ncbi:hypothetical protein K458DRAFT_83944 [Lentithecium fluviatile CBS 122367]|uniref:EGF-like domain-containing protein n=1 Tax=Lentithecium fluviatile CBS 122367 TaxID=1168545 RepID=A0A6G1ISY6_9PLEO|nr:hypothetical protein K458DRAFT_83944 [Lentithecium fluviatile CBS 122367]
MSYPPRVAAWPYGAPDDDEDGGARKGSVRAARERLQASKSQGQKADRSKIVGLPQRPNQLVSQFSAQKDARKQQNLSPSDSRGAAKASSPQWPLPNNADDILDSRPGQFPKPPNRGPPPQRPPRPVSDEFLIQQPTSPDYRASYQSDDILSPTSGPSRPLTTSSAASEASSLGSIPDFPVPQPPMPTIQPLPRRNPSLGPPPSSRRGPSSYYTQVSYVSPIVEEAETRSNTIRSHHGSFASSNVIPSNDDYYMEDGGMRSDDDETITSDNGRISRGSDHDDNSGLVTPALVRQASLGRRTKPSLMTIKSVDSLEKKGASVKRKPSPGDAAMVAGAAGIGSAVLAARDGIAGPRKGSFGNDNALDPTSSSKNSLDSEKDLNFRFVDEFEKEGRGSPTHPLQQATRNAPLADRAGKRPPLRIDVDAVRDAEARGSLTSLPELIRRATRLAANLDRGKTASRLGLDFWESGAPERNPNHRSGSFGDMLAAFPPPGEATPNGANTPNPKRMSKWPSAGEGYGTDSAMSDRKTNRRRRCCGMPMWTFVTLLIVLLFLIAAAVIIPIVLIVIPRMKNTTDTAQQTTGSGNNNSNNNNPTQTAAPTSGSSDQCSGITTCQNGGVAILNADRSCNCVCINGFTGKTCATQGDAGCTTTSIVGTANNATVGSGIPRLIQSAEDQFSIPLNSTRILSLFSSLALSCTAENALITFNGLASRSVARDYIPIIVDTSLTPSRSLPLLDEPHPDQGLRQLQERQTIGDPGEANTNAVTSTTASEASATPTPDQPISSNATALDFARLGVLMALQESGELDTAANAQESIQDFLTQDRNGNSNGNTVNVGPFTIDLVQLSLKFQNGTVIQASSNATASS